MIKYDGMPVKIEIVNTNKELEERLIRRCEALIDYIGEKEVYVNESKEKSTSIGHPYDQRMLRMAISHFQEGFMCMNRAIFNPERVRLPEDPE